MSKQLLSIGLVLLTTRLLTSVLTADETLLEEDKAEPSVSVLCHGRLRHGVVAIGGETTGTTITFNRVTWELQLPDEASREFAKRHHKEPVVVTGVLRKTVGTEVPGRWIVDVHKISERDRRDRREEEGAKVIIRGTLRAVLSRTSDTPELSVNTDGQIWQLEFADDGKTQEGKTQTEAESLIGQPVLLTGSVQPLPEQAERRTANSVSLATQFVRVQVIEASTGTAPESTSGTPQSFK